MQVGNESGQRIGCSTVGGAEAGKALRFDIFFRLFGPPCSMSLVAVCASRDLVEKTISANASVLCRSAERRFWVLSKTLRANESIKVRGATEKLHSSVPHCEAP